MERKPAATGDARSATPSAKKQVTAGFAMADFEHFNTEKAPFRRRAAGATATRS
jgi:hypothetical protein